MRRPQKNSVAKRVDVCPGEQRFRVKCFAFMIYSVHCTQTSRYDRWIAEVGETISVCDRRPHSAENIRLLVGRKFQPHARNVLDRPTEWGQNIGTFFVAFNSSNSLVFSLTAFMNYTSLRGNSAHKKQASPTKHDVLSELYGKRPLSQLMETTEKMKWFLDTILRTNWKQVWRLGFEGCRFLFQS